MKLNEILEKLNGKKIIIYGTGYVAGQFYEGLCIRKKQGQVIAFAETEGIHKTESIHGVPVISVDEIKKDGDSLICIAVHEAIRNEIIQELELRGYSDYIWVYPFYKVLILGDPVKADCYINVKDILRHCPDYIFSIRVLAAEQYYRKNNFGYRVYLKSMSYFSEEKTSEKRLRQYKKLMKSWDENGYLPSEKISVDEKLLSIDGAHRISLAYLHGRDYLVGDIYSQIKNYKDYVKRAYVDSVGQLRDMGLTENEIHAVVTKYEEMKV